MEAKHFIFTYNFNSPNDNILHLVNIMNIFVFNEQRLKVVRNIVSQSSITRFASA